jgi:DNA-3-methyladenine glycosylase
MAPMPRLSRRFFARPTLAVARGLLGQRLVRIVAGQRLAGLITETEAYIGPDDRASHARAGRTPRAAIMFGPPGFAYVYFTYGLHWMLNVVTEAEGFPAAVLIRALRPTEGLDAMRARRGRPPGRAPAGAALTGGPARLAQALGVDGALNGADLCAPEAELFIERARPVPEAAVARGPRVGIARVPEPWRSRPWNFTWRPSP